MRAAKIAIRKSRNKQFFFEFRGGNGETMLVGETYTRRTDAMRGAKRFQRLASLAIIVDESRS